MVIIDPPKSPHGPPTPSRAPLAPPPYVPLSPNSANLSSPPPLRSPGIRPPPSPFSAPASNFLIIKREKADITGSWNINTSLQPAPFISSRSFSTSSDRESDNSSEAGTNTGTDISDPAAQPSSVSSVGTSLGSAARPNLKLFSPRGKIDAAIRVSGAHRAWFEAVSRDEDVTLTFPATANKNGAPRAPIRLLARSTAGDVQVHLPSAFKGTLRVPSDTVLPPSLRSLSVVLSPSDPPIERPPIVDESPVKPKLGLGKAATLPSPPTSPPTITMDDESAVMAPTAPSSPPAPAVDPAPQLRDRTGSDEPVQSGSGVSTPEDTPGVEGSTILAYPPVETPAQEDLPQTPATPPAPNSTAGSASLPPPLSPPIVVVSPTREHHRSVSASASSIHRPSSSSSAHPPLPASTSSTNLTTSNLTSSNVTSHNRSSSDLTHKRSTSNLTSHNRSASNLSIHTTLQPAPTTTSSSESSTLYFIGDLLHSSYDTNAPHLWSGDEFVLDSEDGRVRVFMHGEKAEVGWAEDVAGKVKEAVDWGKWKGVGSGVKSAAGGMQLNMPKISMGRFKFRK